MQLSSAGNESNDQHGVGAVSIDREGFVARAMVEGDFSAPCCRAESHQGRFDYPVTRTGFGLGNIPIVFSLFVADDSMSTKSYKNLRVPKLTCEYVINFKKCETMPISLHNCQSTKIIFLKKIIFPYSIKIATSNQNLFLGFQVHFKSINLNTTQLTLQLRWNQFNCLCPVCLKTQINYIMKMRDRSCQGGTDRGPATIFT